MCNYYTKLITLLIGSVYIYYSASGCMTVMTPRIMVTQNISNCNFNILRMAAGPDPRTEDIDVSYCVSCVER